jgi:hypothetical protein
MDALFVSADGFLLTHSDHIVALATLRLAPSGDAGRINELRDEFSRCLAPSWHLYRPNPEGRSLPIYPCNRSQK